MAKCNRENTLVYNFVDCLVEKIDFINVQTIALKKWQISVKIARFFRQNDAFWEVRRSGKLTERSAEPVRSILAERSAEPFGFGRTLLGTLYKLSIW